MKHLSRIPRTVLGTFVALGAIAIGISAFIITTNMVGAKDPDWPALTMTYKNASTNPDTRETKEITFRLTYTSSTDWKEEIIAAPEVQAGDKTYSEVGYYQQLSGDQYSIYDPITRTTETEQIPENVRRIPRSVFNPHPINAMEEALGKQGIAVTTTTRVCFQDDCIDNAPGWQYEDGGQTVVFADDGRGIPIKSHEFTVDELIIHDAKETIVRPSDDSGENPS